MSSPHTRLPSARRVLPIAADAPEEESEPVESPPYGTLASSLIPADIWSEYQAELARQNAAQEFDLHVELIGTDDSSFDPSLAQADMALLALASVPLFSGLPRSSLDMLGGHAQQLELTAGQHLFREGDAAASFFLVLDGTVEISRVIDERAVTLRHLKRGEAIGLLGLFSGQRRAADARATGRTVVLEVPSEALNQVVLRDPQLQEKVFRFYRERLLEGFLGSSALFLDVESSARAKLIGRFQERRLKAGETLVHPGEVGNLLGVLISGSLLLEHKAKAGELPHLYELYPAQFVAVTSALGGTPARIRIFAEADSTVMLLGHREFTELLREHPALKSLPARLHANARAIDRDVFCGHTGIPGL